MNRCGFTIAGALIVLIVISGIANADSPGGDMGSGMGRNRGMMGGHMMGNDQMMYSPWQKQPESQYPSYQNRQTETQRLREEIRERRHELSDLYRSENPDNELINQKIDELNKLEAELDKRLSTF